MEIARVGIWRSRGGRETINWLIGCHSFLMLAYGRTLHSLIWSNDGAGRVSGQSQTCCRIFAPKRHVSNARSCVIAESGNCGAKLSMRNAVCHLRLSDSTSP